MGSKLSTVLFQPLLLLTASALIGVGLYYQDKKSKDVKYGSDIFKIEVGIAIVIISIAIIIGFFSAFSA